MNPVRTATLVALACIPLLGACDRSTPPAPQDAEAPATSLGKVVDEAECGYMLNDKVIRFAKVIVGS